MLPPGSDEQTARQIGERLQREVQRLRFQEGEQSFGDHVSQGPTVLQADDEGPGASTRADAAMYSASARGTASSWADRWGNVSVLSTAQEYPLWEATGRLRLRYNTPLKAY